MKDVNKRNNMSKLFELWIVLTCLMSILQQTYLENIFIIFQV